MDVLELQERCSLKSISVRSVCLQLIDLRRPTAAAQITLAEGLSFIWMMYCHPTYSIYMIRNTPFTRYNRLSIRFDNRFDNSCIV